MVVITQNMIKQQMELQLASHEWTEALSQALDSRGFRSLTDYADSLPAASLAELASDLGGSPFALEQRLVAEAEAAGMMERCARGLFARALRDELPDGWQPDEPGRCTAIVAQLYRIAGIFLMLLMALPESYHGAVERVELAMGRVELPAGWRPEGSDDPILSELFGSCWHAAPV
jgi:hypothetical protein